MTAPCVLVVDDESDLRELIVLHLNAWGYRTIEAGDGVAALEHLRAGASPTLVLLDLRMPRMNGIELLAEVRADPALASVPVVILTGDRDAGRRAATAGALDFLVKPIDAGELISAVRRYGLQTPVAAGPEEP